MLKFKKYQTSLQVLGVGLYDSSPKELRIYTVEKRYKVTLNSIIANSVSTKRGIPIRIHYIDNKV